MRGLARRYANRGEPLDDLVQVGTIGLIKAIDRFDLSRGVKLSSFATPTILGEIRRHFRDRSWSVRVPRGIQEARAQITQAVSELSAVNGRSPSVREIAEETGLSTDDVLDALAAGSAQRPASLSAAGASLDFVSSHKFRVTGLPASGAGKVTIRLRNGVVRVGRRSKSVLRRGKSKRFTVKVSQTPVSGKDTATKAAFRVKGERR